MRIGDHPEARKVGVKDHGKCPKCGGHKKPEFDLCYDCSRQARGTGRAPNGQGAGGPAAPAKLDEELVFDTFYDENGKTKKEIFYQAPLAVADCFRKAGLGSHALRLLYQGFLSFAGPLRDKRLTFADAQERFGVFYVQRVVRQNARGHLPAAVKDFIDRHRDLALSSPEEMLGLFRYLECVLCYFGDKD